MKVIKKKITLEQFRSRMPSMINSFDENGLPINLNVDSLEDVKIISCYPMGNYGMIPFDIIIPQEIIASSQIDLTLLKPVSGKVGYDIDSYSDIVYDTNVCDDVEFKYYVLEYAMAKRMYHFFEEYNKMILSQNACNNTLCNSAVSSATQYWEYYNGNTIDFQQYQTMDEIFRRYGGIIRISEIEKDGALCKVCTIDGMDKYLTEIVFKTFSIPPEYADYWKTNKLYLALAMKWYEWFKERYPKYSGFTNEDVCNEKTLCDDEFLLDCEDCTEYFRRGGNEMYELLYEFISSSQSINYSSASTSVVLQINMQNTIDDIGEFSVFAEDWVDGVEYASEDPYCQGTIYSGKCPDDSYTITGGTTVYYDDYTWLRICNDEKSYTWDSICKKFLFNPNAWIKYSVAHKNDKELSDSVSYAEFAYNSNDVLFVFNNDGDGSTSSAATNMAVCVDVTTHSNGNILYNGSILPIQEMMYFEYPSSHYVHVTFDGKRYIAYYKGRRLRGEVKNGKVYFNPTRIPCINPIGDEFEMKIGKFISIGNRYVKVDSNDFIPIKNYKYPIFDSYFVFQNQTYYLCNGVLIKPIPTIRETLIEDNSLGQRVANIDDASNETYGYYYSRINQKIYLYKPYVIYKFGILSGRTSSRLTLLERKSNYSDENGNILPGYFEITSASTASQPIEDTILDLPYKVGWVNRLAPIYDNNNEVVAYWGDYLKNIEFYIVDNHNKEMTPLFSTRDYDRDNLRTINKVIETREGLYDSDRLMAKFTYYIGAILYFDEENYEYSLFSEHYNLPKNAESLNGVMYQDICTLVKKPIKYYINSGQSYNIYYYDILFDNEMVTYKVDTVELPMSTFKVVLNTTDIPEWVQGDTEISFSRFNGLDYSPLFRQDYKLGSSSLENITDNIYIERQILKPHEHNLQLLDIHTMDALEKYGNGKIKIINN